MSFRVALAEESTLTANSVDLVTVAQALHWFDIDRFFAEAGRVLKPGGVLAYWTYGNCEIGDGCGDIVQAIYRHVDAYWPPERLIVESGYRDIVPPFPAEQSPDAHMALDWTAAEMLAYVSTWSACVRYRADTGKDPVEPSAERLRDAWGKGRRPVRWPLHVTLCRKPAVAA